MKKIFVTILISICSAILISCGELYPDNHIDMIKSLTVPAHDYGVCIGDALHNWFDGTEEWTMYEEDGTIYVEAKGITQYTFSGEPEEERFVFEVAETQDGFSFVDAYDEEDDRIWTSDYLMWYDDFGQYSKAIAAAFGDAESLKEIKEYINYVNNMSEEEE